MYILSPFDICSVYNCSDGEDMQHVWGRGKVYAGYCWGKLRERDCFEDPGVDGRIILRWIFRKWDVGIWTGSSWFRVGTVGVHL